MTLHDELMAVLADGDTAKYGDRLMLADNVLKLLRPVDIPPEARDHGVHVSMDQCTCPMPGDHTVDQLEDSYPGLYAKMLPERYPFIDGPHLVLGPECFTGDSVEVDQSVISWQGENYYRRTE